MSPAPLRPWTPPWKMVQGDPGDPLAGAALPPPTPNPTPIPCPEGPRSIFTCPRPRQVPWESLHPFLPPWEGLEASEVMCQPVTLHLSWTLQLPGGKDAFASGCQWFWTKAAPARVERRPVMDTVPSPCWVLATGPDPINLLSTPSPAGPGGQWLPVSGPSPVLPSSFSVPCPHTPT